MQIYLLILKIESQEYISSAEGSTPHLLTNPSIIGYPLHLLEFFNSPTWRHLSLSLIVSKYIISICIKPRYGHMMKASKEWWF